MKVHKIGAGAVFVGAVLTGLISAGTASAAGPGISYDGGDGNATTFGSGASANATPGNQALAINTGLNLNKQIPTSTATAIGGTRNTAVTIDGATVVGGGGNNNHGFSALGATFINGGHSNNVVTVAGSSGDLAKMKPISGHDNAIVNFGGTVLPGQPQPNTDEGGTFVNVCDSSFTGQAAHIHVSPGCALG